MKPLIFAYTVKDVLEGTKTLTHRLTHKGQIFNPHTNAVLYGPKLKPVYVVGDEFQILPGYGKKAVATARCIAVFPNDVRKMTAADVKAEGFQSLTAYLSLWIQMHDRHAFRHIFQTGPQGERASVGYFMNYLSERPNKYYSAWGIRFEVIPDTLRNLYLVPEYKPRESV